MPSSSSVSVMPARCHLRVWLRGEDLAAISALEVLRDVVGAHALTGLTRETEWEIGARGASVEALEQQLARVASESLLFANPVKERWRIDVGELRIAPVTGRFPVGVLVRDLPDRAGESRAAQLGEDWGIGGARVARHTLWVLDLPDLGRDATIARGRALAITTGRSGGLLVNPHYQEWSILCAGEAAA